MMLGEPWPYWAVFALALLAWLAVPAAAWYERRRDAEDKAAWDALHQRRMRGLPSVFGEDDL